MDLFFLVIVMWFAYRYMTQKTATQASGTNGNTSVTPPVDTYRTDFAALADEVNIYREAYAEKAREAGINPRALYDSWLIVGEAYEEARIEAFKRTIRVHSLECAMQSLQLSPKQKDLCLPSYWLHCLSRISTSSHRQALLLLNSEHERAHLQIG